MSPLEKEVIRKKIAIIIENLKLLNPITDLTNEEYLKDVYKRKATERLLQELIEAAIDINTHIIVQTGSKVPDDYYESFIKMGEIKIISVELAERLAPSAGLRNRLVHEYDLLEHSIVFNAVKMTEKLYPAYVKEIENFLSS
ncbi:MAG: hypothetical protein A2W05_08230 [Candidatus Schekmanbacteria bacterium RBG_16_38_10]|uniref:DUF86 domain-containing protein n=1 Tax=Candidatus Schekmanbacteria bacterium RBG_16_38_10 TaxID=1817879 RepID=A0A1F7RRI0_9BACT|nr:MAG: hypothetical protein A2W05_08230 [Candidatus Schekmanbacteria bacterium RBG_16_38_10]